MQPLELIEARHDLLSDLCRRYAVHRLRLFVRPPLEISIRSAVTSISWSSEPVGLNRFRQFFGFRRSLADLLDRAPPGGVSSDRCLRSVIRGRS